MHAPRLSVPASIAFRLVAFITLTFITLAAAPRMFARPALVPIERVIKNLQAFLKKSPDDHDLHYRMARSRFLAVANLSMVIPARVGQGKPASPVPRHLASGLIGWLRYEEAMRRAKKKLGEKPGVPMQKDFWKRLTKLQVEINRELYEKNWRPKPPKPSAILEHAAKGMSHYDKAIALSPKTALYHLGRTSLAETCVKLELLGKMPKRRVTKGISDFTYRSVRDLYFATFDREILKDLRLKNVPIEGFSGLVSFEAGVAYLRLAKDVRKSKTVPKELREDRDAAETKLRKERVAVVESGLVKLRKKRQRLITPILIGSRADDRCVDLIDADARVHFDLDGDDVPEPRRWVRPKTGILVWDPMGHAEITSGRQLFGSVTFDLFQRDGYRALQLLDDDQDGELSGLELAGLAVWYDRDGDAVSTADEVSAVWRLDITAIATGAERDGDGVLANPHGVLYRDGTHRPTFDWVAEPLPEDDATESRTGVRPTPL